RPRSEETVTSSPPSSRASSPGPNRPRESPPSVPRPFSAGPPKLGELRSRLKEFAAPRTLDDHVGGATNHLHPLRVRRLRLALPVGGGEIGIVDVGDEFICGCGRCDPEGA